MYRPRQLNPLGIRKLDVQKPRRESYRAHKAEAKRLVEFWFGDPYHRGESREMTTDEVVRLVAWALDSGWKEGVTVGAKATRDRVAESLGNGTLVKPKEPA